MLLQITAKSSKHQHMKTSLSLFLLSVLDTQTGLHKKKSIYLASNVLIKLPSTCIPLLHTLKCCHSDRVQTNPNDMGPAQKVLWSHNSLKVR
jgi:hypothetical protein